MSHMGASAEEFGYAGMQEGSLPDAVARRARASCTAPVGVGVGVAPRESRAPMRDM
jgi:hypothetical protein